MIDLDTLSPEARAEWRRIRAMNGPDAGRLACDFIERHDDGAGVIFNANGKGELVRPTFQIKGF